MKINKRKSAVPRSMMGIACPTGSHLPVLEEAALAAGNSLIIEHGAGIYSTPLLAALGCNVICVEPHKGWAEWARWIYSDNVTLVESAIALRLADAALVFLDGPAKERGPLLKACLDASVPTIIAHDTNKREWNYYGWDASMFAHDRYDITHTAEDSHRTTRWSLRT
jgi:hypothetical protein